MFFMQFSVAPWRILDKEHLDIVVEAAQLHEKFGDYILDYANRKSNYGVTGDAIKFILAKKDNELVKFEKEFLSRFLDSVLSTTVTIKHEDGYSYLVSGNVSVRLDFIDESVISAINKHNANIEKRNLEMEKQKSLQLKMEGF